MRIAKYCVLLLVTVFTVAFAMQVTKADQTVIGGQPAAPGQFPSYAFIENCGARLLFEGDVEKNIPSVFITDGHCVVLKFGNPAECIVLLDKRVPITVGDSGPENEGTEQKLRSLKVVVHPNYPPNCNGNYDMALIFAPPLGANHFVHASQLLLPTETAALKVGTTLTLAGKGLIQYSPTPVGADRLYWANYQVQACTSTRYPNMFCTGTGQDVPAKDSCFGDSGSGIEMTVNGVIKAAGAVVYVTCGKGSININYAAADIHSWLVSEVQKYTGFNFLTPTPVSPFGATATPTLTPTPTRSVDSDNDAVVDKVEDTNQNGVFTDDDNDYDDIPNYLDTDDDNDGVLWEGDSFYGHPFCVDGEDYPDTDCDGRINIYSADDDGDGIPSKCETDEGFHQWNKYETPSDSISDHVDSDDDNDGIQTQYELGLYYQGECNVIRLADNDGDGIPAYKDPTEHDKLALPGPTQTPSPTPTRIDGVTANWRSETITVTTGNGFTNTLVITNGNNVSVAVKLTLKTPLSVEVTGWEVVSGPEPEYILEKNVPVEVGAHSEQFVWPTTTLGFGRQQFFICWNWPLDCHAFQVIEEADKVFLPLVKR